MPTALRKSRISPEEYLALERTAEVRHEYVDGEVFAMVGGTLRHNTITMNIGMALRPAARRRGCEAYVNDVKVRIEAANAYYYPDVVVTCESTSAEQNCLHAPSLIVEVLSPTTEAVDRREKRVNYQTVPSLRDILLVSQDERRINHYRRDSGEWIHDVVTEGAITLVSLDPGLDLETVYG